MDYTLYKGAWVASDVFHEEELSRAACVNLLKTGGVIVRNAYDFDCHEATSFWYVIKDSFGGMEELSSKMRNQVRKSLKTYDVRRISREDFCRVALPVYNAALASYKVKAQLVTQDYIVSTSQGVNKEFWGVYAKDGGQVVAVAVNTLVGGSCYYNSLKALPEAMHNSTYPYYGLLYEMNRYYLQECGLHCVCDGARSITEHSNIQPFLIDKFHFRKAYCRLRITYKWWFGVVVRLLYPLRNIINHPKIKAVLSMEAMARNEI